MKDVPVGFDVFAFSTIKQTYCDNNKCKWYGFVVVAGNLEEKNEV